MDNNSGHIATLPRTNVQDSNGSNGINTKSQQKPLSASTQNLASRSNEANKGSMMATTKPSELASPVTVARSDSVLSKMLPEVKRKVGVQSANLT